MEAIDDPAAARMNQIAAAYRAVEEACAPRSGTAWARLSPPHANVPWVEIRLFAATVVNFWFPYQDEIPHARLESSGIPMPANYRVTNFVPAKFCTISAPDCSSTAAILLVAGIFSKLHGYSESAPLETTIIKARPDLSEWIQPHRRTRSRSRKERDSVVVPITAFERVLPHLERLLGARPSPTTARARAARTVDRIVVEILRRLKRANGSRRRKVLSASTVAETLALLVSGAQGAWAWSGSNSWGFHPGSSTVALGVRNTKGNVVLRSAEGTNQRVSPGRIWVDLKPWRPGTRSIERKLDAWARGGGAGRVNAGQRRAPAAWASSADMEAPEPLGKAAMIQRPRTSALDAHAVGGVIFPPTPTAPGPP